MFRTFSIVLLIFPALTQAASFDCKNAGTKIELMICKDGPLSYNDILLDETYRSMKIVSEDGETLREQQLSWLKERNSCEHKECVRKAYENRLRQLIDHAPICADFRKRYTWGTIFFEKPLAKGNVAEFFKIIGSEKVSPSLQSTIEDGGNDSTLYKFNLNQDGTDDFVIVTYGGTANCGTPFVISSSEHGFVLAPGFDYDRYGNEGKLCSKWGQSLEFVSLNIFGKMRPFAVIKDVVTEGEKFTLSLVPLNDSVKTAEICKIEIKLSSMQQQ